MAARIDLTDINNPPRNPHPLNPARPLRRPVDNAQPRNTPLRSTHGRPLRDSTSLRARRRREYLAGSLGRGAACGCGLGRRAGDGRGCLVWGCAYSVGLVTFPLLYPII